MKLPDNVQREFNEWWERQPEGLVPKMRRDINKRELELFLHRILATQDGDATRDVVEWVVENYDTLLTEYVYADSTLSRSRYIYQALLKEGKV